MSTFKIIEKKNNGHYEGIYLGVDRTFEYNTQTSESKRIVHLPVGTKCEIETEACKSIERNLEIDSHYHIEGIWYNYYKTDLMTFVALSTRKIKI